MGANPDTVTALHYAEYLAALPSKKQLRRHFLVPGQGRAELVCVRSLDDELGIADREGEDYFALILKAYLATGSARSGQVGGAESELIDAAEIVRFGARWMEEHLS